MSDDPTPEERPIGDDYITANLWDLPNVESRAVQAIVGFPIVTIHQWIGRSLTGASISVRGRARQFDPMLVLHLAVMAKLVRLGFGSPAASVVAYDVLRHRSFGSPDLKLLIGPSPPYFPASFNHQRPTYLVEAKDLGEALRAVEHDWEGCLTIVDVGALVTDARAAILDAARRPLTQQQADHIEDFYVMIRQLSRVLDPNRAQMIEYLRGAIAADRSFNATMKAELRARITKDLAFDDATKAEMLSIVVAGAAEAEGPPPTPREEARRAHRRSIETSNIDAAITAYDAAERLVAPIRHTPTASPPPRRRPSGKTAA